MTMRTIISGSLVVLLAACGGGSSRIGGVGTTTTNVQVLNASTINIDLLEDQTVGAGNSNIAFSAASLCMTVETVSHGLSVRPAGAHTTAAPLPSFATNERYIVPVTGNSTALSPLSIRNSFTPASGDGGVRLINVSGAGSFDVYVTAPGASLTVADASNVASGSASVYFDVPAGTKQIRLTANQSGQVAFDVGNVSIVAGGRTMVVLAPPASGGTAARPFVFQLPPNNGGC